MTQLAFLFGGRTKDSVLYVVTRQAWRFREDFALWLSENWAVWLRFEAEANAVYGSGRRHYSARTIGEYLRHETAVRSTNDGEWKVNDHRWPDLARLYLTLYPERGGFFELRDSKQRKAA
jgi:hypothetical protein